MANLGDFFELVFAAKVYQRLNPENYSNLKIVNKTINENFEKKCLSNAYIKQFLFDLNNEKKIVGKQMYVKLESDEKTYINKNIEDTIKCSLHIRSYILNVRQFSFFYLSPKKITEEHIHDTFENLKNNPQKITKGVAAVKDKLDKIDLTKQPDKKTVTMIKKIVKKAENINIRDKISRRSRNFNRILDYDIEIVPEIKHILKLRNRYLADEKKQDLSFEVYMTGESREEGKVAQGKTDIKINFIVTYTENNVEKTKNYTYGISLKYDSDRLQTASQNTIDNLNQLLYIDAIADATNKSDNLKKLICNLIYDNIDKKNPQSLIKFTGTKTLYLRKDKLMKVLEKLEYSNFKKYTNNNENFIIKYGNSGFLRIRKGTDNYTIETLDYFDTILDLIDPPKK